MAGYHIPKAPGHSGGGRRTRDESDDRPSSSNRHREPLGFRLRRYFKYAACGAALVYGGLGANEYNKLPQSYPGYYPGFMVNKIVMHDGPKALGIAGSAWGTASVWANNTFGGVIGLERKELAREGNNMVYCIDPALAVKGWDDPPNDTMAEFKIQAIKEMQAIYTGSKIPGSRYTEGPYKNKNIIAFIQAGQYERFAAGEEIGPIVVAQPTPEVASCPVDQGYKQRKPFL